MTAPLILLPGMMCDERLFGPQSDAVQPTVLPITGADNVQALAARVLAQAPDRFALGGLSMGGIVAMEVLRQAPDRVAGLALMDTNPLAEDDAVKVRRQPQIDKAVAGRLATIMRDEMKPTYLNDGPTRAGILDLCMDMALSLGPDVFIRQSRALRDRPDQCDTLRSYHGPALVLCGQEDRLCPPSRHELMHDLLPNAVLHVIEGAGHLPTLEQPARTTDALCAWLKET